MAIVAKPITPKDLATVCDECKRVLIPFPLEVFVNETNRVWLTICCSIERYVEKLPGDEVRKDV